MAYISTRRRTCRAAPVGVIYFVLGPETGSAELYSRFTRAASEAGFVTAVLHPRGTGYSDGLRGDIDDYALFLADLDRGLEWAHQRAPTDRRALLAGLELVTTGTV